MSKTNVPSTCTMRTVLFNVSQFSFPLLSTADLNFYEQLGGCQENQRTLILPVHLVNAPCFQWSPSFHILQFLLRIILVNLCSQMCVCPVWSFSLDCILLIFRQSLGSLDHSFAVSFSQRIGYLEYVKTNYMYGWRLAVVVM